MIEISFCSSFFEQSLLFSKKGYTLVIALIHLKFAP